MAFDVRLCRWFDSDPATSDKLSAGLVGCQIDRLHLDRPDGLPAGSLHPPSVPSFALTRFP